MAQTYVNERSLLGAKRPDWQAESETILMRVANHVAFGLDRGGLQTRRARLRLSFLHEPRMILVLGDASGLPVER